MDNTDNTVKGICYIVKESVIFLWRVLIFGLGWGLDSALELQDGQFINYSRIKGKYLSSFHSSITAPYFPVFPLKVLLLWQSWLHPRTPQANKTKAFCLSYLLGWGDWGITFRGKAINIWILPSTVSFFQRSNILQFLAALYHFPLPSNSCVFPFYLVLVQYKLLSVSASLSLSASLKMFLSFSLCPFLLPPLLSSLMTSIVLSLIAGRTWPQRRPWWEEPLGKLQPDTDLLLSPPVLGTREIILE